MKVCTTPLPWIVGLGIGWATAFTLPSSLVRLTPLQQQQSFSWKPTTTIQRYATIPEKGQDVENKVVVRSSSSISSLNKIATQTADSRSIESSHAGCMHSGYGRVFGPRSDGWFGQFGSRDHTVGQSVFGCRRLVVARISFNSQHWRRYVDGDD